MLLLLVPLCSFHSRTVECSQYACKYYYLLIDVRYCINYVFRTNDVWFRCIAGFQAISPTRLLLFGGDDGGHLRGSRGYELSHLNDLWMLDIVAGVWECVDQGGPATPQRPAPRAHHAAVLLSDRVSMLVVGGIHYDDVWVYNTKLNVWSEISMGTYTALVLDVISMAWQTPVDCSSSDCCARYTDIAFTEILRTNGTSATF